MNHYNCFSSNQLKIMFLVDENNEREREREREIQSISIKQILHAYKFQYKYFVKVSYPEF